MKNIVCLFLAFFLFTSAALANELKPIPRRVLVIYDARQNSDPFFSSFHQQAEVWLNHLGLQAYYWRNDWPLPGPEYMQGVRGVVTWFNRASVFSNPSEYCAWMKKNMQQGLKWVIWGEPGLFEQGKSQLSEECSSALANLGLDYRNEFSENRYFFEVVHKEARWVEFERTLSFTDPLLYELYKPSTKNIEIKLSVKRRDIPNSDSVMVMTSPNGGFVQRSYVMAVSPDRKKFEWRINPKLFFEAAFQMQGLPIPDVTTQNGKRVLLSNIDGDGIFNASSYPLKNQNQTAYSGEVILEEILKKFSNLPITVSLISGYLDMSNYQSPRILQMYRDILQLSNVEVAAHAYAHPLQWKSTEGPKLSLKVPNYQFDPVKEVELAISRLQKLLDDFQISKKVCLMSWSGNTLPEEQSIQTATKLRVENINGGMTRMDKDNPSYSTVYPLGIRRGNELQVYSPMSNENVYTNLWQGPFYGFRDLEQTFKNTESPLRLKPMMIYYHYYSGEQSSSLNAVENLYQYALSQDPFPLFTSEYAAQVKDLFEAQIYQKSANQFKIKSQGQIKTLRFENEKRNLDMDLSKNVLGFSHFQGALWIWLDASKSHDVVLTSLQSKTPYLVASNAKISAWKLKENQISFNCNAWIKPQLILAGLKKGAAYLVEALNESRLIVASSAGELRISFDPFITNKEFHVRVLPKTN